MNTYRIEGTSLVELTFRSHPAEVLIVDLKKVVAVWTAGLPSEKGVKVHVECSTTRYVVTEDYETLVGDWIAVKKEGMT